MQVALRVAPCGVGGARSLPERRVDVPFSSSMSSDAEAVDLTCLSSARTASWTCGMERGRADDNNDFVIRLSYACVCTTEGRDVDAVAFRFVNGVAPDGSCLAAQEKQGRKEGEESGSVGDIAPKRTRRVPLWSKHRASGLETATSSTHL